MSLQSRAASPRPAQMALQSAQSTAEAPAQVVRPIRIGLSRISVRSTGLAPLILSESSSLFEALANILSK